LIPEFLLSAVVVPCLLALQEEGFGVSKGIPTLVIAASSIDDVLAISAFTILLGITFKPTADIVAVVFQAGLPDFDSYHITKKCDLCRTDTFRNVTKSFFGGGVCEYTI
jgi:hypothetical protein